MIITEAVFACLREWHDATLARAFFADDEGVFVLFSAMNILPGNVETTEAGESATALELHTRCCHGSRPFLEPERLQIARLLRFRPLFQEKKKSVCVSDGNEVDECSAASSTSPDGRNIIARLLVELHASSCWWRQGEFVQQMLKTPRFSLADAAIIRHRCAAVVVTDEISSASPLTSLDAMSAGDSHAKKLLLPRGSPPSFLHGVLSSYLLKWLRAKRAQSLSHLTSNTPMSLLRVIFSLKRPRSSEESDEHGNDESDELISCVSLLMALFGYTLTQTPSCNTCDASEVHKAWRQLCVDIQCHFCGGRPRLTLEKTVAEEPLDQSHLQEQKNEEDVMEGEHNKHGENGEALLTADSTSRQKPGEPVGLESHAQLELKTSLQTPMNPDENKDAPAQVVAVCNEDKKEVSLQSRFRYTIEVSEQDELSGHHNTCPWKALFLSAVIADTTSSFPSKEVIFNLCNADEEGGSLQMCFKLPEVAKLIKCWRRSLYAESVWKEMYIRHPLPEALSSVIPSPADSGTEAFLERLASRIAGEETLQLKPPTPLFDDRSPWDSYFRVASFLKASAVVDHGGLEVRGKDTTEIKKPPNVEEGRHWKTVYDMGRRCILAAVEEGGSELAVELSEKFKEQYRHCAQQDAAVGHTSLPLEGVMRKLVHLLDNTLSVDSLHGRKAALGGLFEGPKIAAQEQKNVHSFLDALDDVVENATHEPPPRQQTDPAKRPVLLQGNNNDTTFKKGGGGGGKAGNSGARLKQPKQPQKQKQHQYHHHQHQQHQQQHQRQQHQQQLRQQSMPVPMAQHVLLPSPTEGVFPFSARGTGSGVLPTPVPVFQQQQQPPPHLPFQPALHGIPFTSCNQNTVLGGDSVGVLDDAYMQRPSVMGQCQTPVVKPPQARMGGRGGNHRGARGGGRGGGNAFKG
ncbi:hypothetical protein MOQ_006234 [Trypanosoma cruzi marinkellei]|uniref:Uncharacterized protein n=1 Tax=Trypanosoma cruzi marinkellei TaxID=85056 RepID=K2M4V6_TRYCR|nr:hypothetical protein MOQ_006234 [Trypanosoma cruzi marinkellei]